MRMEMLEFQQLIADNTFAEVQLTNYSRQEPQKLIMLINSTDYELYGKLPDVGETNN